ncbi:hypothetical protein [Amycolatopsis sp. NPDC051102]|uniref:hypothetical protein n=1 Tax=Amycolatopsis sp. NPDC051102 TaxID=3155163 RepID=UPI003413FED7
MMKRIPGIRDGLSWQQRWTSTLLQRDGEGPDELDAREVRFRVPDEMSDEVLRSRLDELIACEHSLQITYLEDRPDGHLEFAPGIDAPWEQNEADSFSQLPGLPQSFQRQSGTPLWHAMLTRHPDEQGKVVRTLSTSFDYHISDGTSARLFRDVLLGSKAVCQLAGGGYPEWLSWQRATFPENAYRQDNEANTFWRRYLEGITPDTPPAFPFARRTGGRLSGTTTSILSVLPVPLRTLRATSGRLRSSPFILLLAAIVCGIARAGSVTDTVLRTNVVGRRPENRRTLGAIADILPVRVRHNALADPHKALEAATASWLDVLPWYTTPWEYSMQLCGEPDPAKRTLSHPQVLFNFIPWAKADERDLGIRQYQAELGTFQLVVRGGPDDQLWLACDFDSERLELSGVESLIDHINDAMLALTI